MKVGVFDSGVGGLSVVNAIKTELPELKVIYKEDKEHVPYGTREIDEIHKFVLPILKSMQAEGCRVIVVACNTVTTNLIKKLRQELQIPLVGMEPMVKPAAIATKTGVIAVCATPKTLSSTRYRWLRSEYAKGVKVLEPGCSGWAEMIEANQINRKKIATIVNSICDEGADQIVLGCTHYHWIEELIRELAEGRASVLQPEIPVIEQLKRILQDLQGPSSQT